MKKCPRCGAMHDHDGATLNGEPLCPKCAQETFDELHGDDEESEDVGPDEVVEPDEEDE